MEGDIATLADDLGGDLDQRLSKRRQRPMLYFLRYGELLLWVRCGPSAAPPGRSAPEGEAEGIEGKADLAARRSAPGGRADLPRPRPEQPLIAETVEKLFSVLGRERMIRTRPF